MAPSVVSAAPTDVLSVVSDSDAEPLMDLISNESSSAMSLLDSDDDCSLVSSAGPVVTLRDGNQIKKQKMTMAAAKTVEREAGAKSAAAEVTPAKAPPVHSPAVPVAAAAAVPVTETAVSVDVKTTVIAEPMVTEITDQQEHQTLVPLCAGSSDALSLPESLMEQIQASLVNS